MHVSVLCLLSVFLTFPTVAQNVRVYPAPPGAKQAPDFRLFVNGKEVFVYDNPVAAYAYFDMAGDVTVEIKPAIDIKWVDVRPVSLGITPSWKNGSITFTLKEPCKISVELNRNIGRPLFIFANPPEQAIPDRHEKNVIFYESGKVHDVGIVELKSNQTVYIEGGAIVKGVFIARNAENVTIRGRGILDGSEARGLKADYLKWTRLINIVESKNVIVRDIILHNSNTWQVVPVMSENINITNLKLISGNPSDDGIDIVRSSHVTVDNCFIRVKDDCVAIKAFMPDNKNRGVHDISVKNCVLWNAEWGNGIETGFELLSNVSDVTFRNIDIIHVESGAVLSIHNSGKAIVQNVLYEDIRIEQAAQKLFDLAIFRSRFSEDKPETEAEISKLYLHGAWDNVMKIPPEDSLFHAQYRGWIRDITFRNIRLLDGPLPYSIFNGFDKDHLVENVTIDGLWVCGQKIKDMKKVRFYKKFSKNIILR